MNFKYIFSSFLMFLLLSDITDITGQANNNNATKIADDLTGMRAIGSPANPKVPMSWRKYQDYAQMTKMYSDLQKAYPNLIKVESIGKSVEGRDIHALTITDHTVGVPDRKPAFYIDGGIHANELNGTEIALYTAWYLCESYDHISFIKDLLKEKTFYILPNISPDARDNFIHKPNTASTSRSGMRQFDDDGDGLTNEDKLDDLDGDGNIVMMRRKSKTGRWKQDPKYPTRMYMVQGDELGEYEMLGSEGIDNDADGLVNEDNEGAYDPNRDWAWNWQPHYVQNGALFYPGSLPETKAVKDFIVSKTNIAGAQSYHNYGGMLLRGPGAEEDRALYTPEDNRVYDQLGKVGEKMLPGYRYFYLYKDLYTVYGGEIDFLALTRGIYTFSNELMTSYKLFTQKSELGRFENDEFNEFDKYLLFGDAYVPWKTFNHPQFGEIEVGGSKKNYIRNHPGFMFEEDAHRNMAFTILHAHQTPKLEIVDVKIKDLGNNLKSVTATITNRKIIPTHSSFDIRNKITPPDYISLDGATVVAGMTVQNEDLNLFTEQAHNPKEIEINNISGMGEVKVRWLVTGNTNNTTVTVNSTKGGTVKHTIK